MQGIQIPIGLDMAPLNRSLAQVKGKIQSGLGQTLKSLRGMLAVGSVGVAVAAYKNLAEEFDRIGKLAARFNTDAETMQRLGRLAGLAGADVETLARAMTRAGAAIGGTDATAKLARKSLEGLGIDAERFIKAGLEERVYMLADAYQTSGGNGKAFSDVLDLIGMRGAELVPMLKEGGDALRAMGDAMTVVSNENVAAMEAMNDAWDELVSNIKAGVAGPITDSLRFYSAMMQEIKEFGIENLSLKGIQTRMALGGNAVIPKGEGPTLGLPETTTMRNERIWAETAKTLSDAVNAQNAKDAAGAAPLGIPALRDLLRMAPAMQSELQSRAGQQLKEAVRLLFEGPDAKKSAASSSSSYPSLSDIRDIVNSDLVRIGGARGIGALGDQGLELQRSADRKLGEIAQATKTTAEKLSGFAYA